MPHVDVASAAMNRMNFGPATSSGQPSPIISTKRVPQKILDATVSGNMSPNHNSNGQAASQQAAPVKKNNYVGEPSDRQADMIHIKLQQDLDDTIEESMNVGDHEVVEV